MRCDRYERYTTIVWHLNGGGLHINLIIYMLQKNEDLAKTILTDDYPSAL